MTFYRSVLFTPAVEPAKMQKALSTQADIVVFDLEDGVSEGEKETARRRLASFLHDISTSQVTNRPAIYVRINGLQTQHYLQDLSVGVDPEVVEGIMLPKTEASQDVLRVDALLGSLEAEYKQGFGSLQVFPLVESAVGIRNAYDVARGPRVNRIAFGSMDFIADIGASWTKDGQEVLFARSKLVMDSRAAGIEPPIDTIYPNIRDTEGLQREAKHAKNLGFQGKLVIHPAQIEPVNNAFSPTDEEVAWAEKVVAAYETDIARGKAVRALDGELIEKPVAERARRILALAKARG